MGGRGEERGEGRDELTAYCLRLLYKFYDISVFFFSLVKSKYCGG